ncbi:hypothetical protein M0804_003392 [Polistes exclamans]|nr:hypothetical protein M0804_003392 [Polistes exclamans]
MVHGTGFSLCKGPTGVSSVVQAQKETDRENSERDGMGREWGGKGALWNRWESDVSYVESGQPAELYHDPGPTTASATTTITTTTTTTTLLYFQYLPSFYHIFLSFCLCLSLLIQPNPS